MSTADHVELGDRIEVRHAYGSSHLRGTVIQVDEDRGSILIDRGDDPGWTTEETSRDVLYDTDNAWLLPSGYNGDQITILEKWTDERLFREEPTCPTEKMSTNANDDGWNSY